MTITFDFPNKRIIYSARLHKKVSADALRQKAGEQGLLGASSQVRLTARRTLTGRVELAFSGPAIEHIYRALPIFGAPMTTGRADALRETLDRETGKKTTLFVRDLNKLVVLLCSS